MRILIVQTGFLGDVILTTPVLTGLRKLYPHAELTVLTTPKCEEIIRNHPAINDTLTFDKRRSESGFLGLLQVVGRLREKRFDVVFSLHKSYRTALLLRLSGIPKRYGFREAKAWFLYTQTARRNDLPHEALRNLAILRTLDLEPRELDSRLSLQVSLPGVARVEQLLGTALSRNCIGVAPGSAWLTKRWTIEGFSQVCRELTNWGYQVLLLGGDEDQKCSLEIERLADAKVLNLVGKLSLSESVACVSKLVLLISNDSAPLHMGSALSVPTVALYCATIPEFGFGPWQTESESVGVMGLSCRPCGRHGGNSCPTGTYACQRSLTPEMVLAAAERLLVRTKKVVGS